MNNGKTVYTFIWYIENYSYCWHPNGECLVSPKFAAEDMEGTSWEIKLYPRGRKAEDKGHISLYLSREIVDEGPEEFPLKYEMSFLAADGSMLNSTSTEFAFKNAYGRGCPKFRKMNAVLVSRKTDYLPRDTLSVCCKMWKIEGNEQQRTIIYSRTHIGVEHISLYLDIESFSTIKPHEKKIINFKTPSKIFDLSSELYLSDGSCCSEKIMVKIATTNSKHILSKIKICLLDVSGKEIDCGEIDNREDAIGKENRIWPLSLNRQDILKKKSEYLPDDKLSLSCECSFCTGVEYEKIERSVHKKPIVASRKQSTEKLSVLKCLLVAVFACIFGVCMSYLIENLSTPLSIW